MNPSKQQMIKDFLYEIILTDEFFDILYDTISEEVDLEDEDVQDLLAEHEERYEANLISELSAFMDANFTEQEITELVEQQSEAVLAKFDSLSDKFYEIIETNTQKFVEGFLDEINACSEENTCCRH